MTLVFYFPLFAMSRPPKHLLHLYCSHFFSDCCEWSLKQVPEKGLSSVCSECHLSNFCCLCQFLTLICANELFFNFKKSYPLISIAWFKRAVFTTWWSSSCLSGICHSMLVGRLGRQKCFWSQCNDSKRQEIDHLSQL